ncbi:MAG TPA: peptidoglycan DD-metalloendopeptidase family protein [Chthoniobacterales bacterium]|jgi:murein DD-endopeptidase MepM/ murein hydrolase activator NlpD|nr:peptidoglycan DD-metalloendopeptidase family protein [Chthoniobacterales bacterium]
MSRKALSSLIFSLALLAPLAPLSAQEIFVPRELKAQAVHPPATKEAVAETKPAKPKEIVRRAEAVTESDLKAPEKKSAPVTAEAAKPKAQKTEVIATKVEKTVAAKEKAAPPGPAKVEKPAVVSVETAPKKVAKAETVKPEPAKEKTEKPKAVAKTEAASDDAVATIKVEKAPAPKVAAKTETAKPEPKKEKAVADVPTIKIEKATAAKEPVAPAKTIAKTEPAKPEAVKEKSEKPAPAKEKPSVEIAAKSGPAKTETAVAKTEKASPKEESRKTAAKSDGVQIETITAKTEKPVVKERPATVAVTPPRKTEEKVAAAKEEPVKTAAAKTEPAKPAVTVAKTDKPASAKEKPATTVAKADPPSPREGPANPAKMLPVNSEVVAIPSQKDAPQILPPVTGSLDTGLTKIADGFDFPVGKPEAEGYYKARGFRPGGHVGEDWDGIGGGDTDMRDPIFSIGDGIVVFARDVHLGWGNVIIVRHAYRENGNVKYIDALYGHLHNMMVSRGQRVTRGQQIGTMGNAHGRYDAHLHFEIRKNLEIGMSRSKFQKNFSNYYDPTQFIASHRRLSGGGSNYKVAMNTFTHDWMFKFDSNRNFPARKRSTSESSAALRRALTSNR